MSDVSWSVSSLRFVPSIAEDTLLSRTMRIVPEDVGPEKVSACKENRTHSVYVPKLTVLL